MKFGEAILSPSYLRESEFDSTVISEKQLEFKCLSCKEIIKENFSSLIGKEFSWESEFSKNEVEQIKKFYEMNAVGKSPDGGFSAILKIECEICRTHYLIYAGINEYCNSAHKITLQGITEIIDESNRTKIQRIKNRKSRRFRSVYRCGRS